VSSAKRIFLCSAGTAVQGHPMSLILGSIDRARIGISVGDCNIGLIYHRFWDTTT